MEEGNSVTKSCQSGRRDEAVPDCSVAKADSSESSSHQVPSVPHSFCSISSASPSCPASFSVTSSSPTSSISSSSSSTTGFPTSSSSLCSPTFPAVVSPSAASTSSSSVCFASERRRFPGRDAATKSRLCFPRLSPQTRETGASGDAQTLAGDRALFDGMQTIIPEALSESAAVAAPEGREAKGLNDTREATRPSSVAELLSDAELLGGEAGERSTCSLKARESRGRKIFASLHAAAERSLGEASAGTREGPKEQQDKDPRNERTLHTASAESERSVHTREKGREGREVEGLSDQRGQGGRERSEERGCGETNAEEKDEGRGTETDSLNAGGENADAFQKGKTECEEPRNESDRHTSPLSSVSMGCASTPRAESRSDARSEETEETEDKLSLSSPERNTSSTFVGPHMESKREDHCASPRLSSSPVSLPSASSPPACPHSRQEGVSPPLQEKLSPLDSSSEEECFSASDSSRATRSSLVESHKLSSSAEDPSSSFSGAFSQASASRNLPEKTAAEEEDFVEDSTSDDFFHSPDRRCSTRDSSSHSSTSAFTEGAIRGLGGEEPEPAGELRASVSEEPGSSPTPRTESKVRTSDAGDLDVWIAGFHRNPPEILSEADLWRVCQRIKQLLVEENNVQPVPAPCIVCGDIHGQFFDLLKLFEVGGNVGEQNYIFLGDYVDRGYNSVETFEYLMLLKLKYPRHITLLRGNHESRQITTVYGFYDECVRKYGNANPWKFCTEVFDYLALAAVIDDSVFCVHGGLSPDLKLLDQLRLIYRVQEIPHEGTFGDIVWSDPDDVEEWAENPRGAGWLFGDKVVKRFNHLNGLELIARAHQLAMEGFRYIFPDSSVVTVWSAPNYCYRCGNVAAVMKLDSALRRRMLIFKQTDEHQVATRARAIAPYFL
ncbi:putative serine/threonine protein phosphatase [Toxoplasma gondii MAS]|uniref:Serine/threonine-protein phosphatase n=2 Tax=Toxoplasma gondii TaxID=5811 RepID=A0A086PT75_TOXGO|nr:putative serine/threonine protein phosphatase [Toxoplasma gondii MAS]PUA84133.1 putative serine/threonine protein phosphatase [Toxoplasma gondii TgCATBr9]